MQVIQKRSQTVLGPGLNPAGGYTPFAPAKKTKLGRMRDRFEAERSGFELEQRHAECGGFYLYFTLVLDLEQERAEAPATAAHVPTKYECVGQSLLRPVGTLRARQAIATNVCEATDTNM